MAAALPLTHGLVPLASPAGTEHLLAHSRQIEREQPEFLAALGVTAEQLAAEMAKPGLKLAEAVSAGWISEEERRLYEGRASLEDLLANGFSEEEARAVLLEQEQESRGCASSS